MPASITWSDLDPERVGGQKTGSGHATGPRLQLGHTTGRALAARVARRRPAVRPGCWRRRCWPRSPRPDTCAVHRCWRDSTGCWSAGSRSCRRPPASARPPCWPTSPVASGNGGWSSGGSRWTRTILRTCSAATSPPPSSTPGWMSLFSTPTRPGPRRPAVQQMGMLARAIQQHGAPCLLVLDEVDRLPRRTVDLIDLLVKRAPANLHVAMAFRTDPGARPGPVRSRRRGGPRRCAGVSVLASRHRPLLPGRAVSAGAGRGRGAHGGLGGGADGASQRAGQRGGGAGRGRGEADRELPRRTPAARPVGGGPRLPARPGGLRLDRCGAGGRRARVGRRVGAGGGVAVPGGPAVAGRPRRRRAAPASAVAGVLPRSVRGRRPGPPAFPAPAGRAGAGPARPSDAGVAPGRRRGRQPAGRRADRALRCVPVVAAGGRDAAHLGRPVPDPGDPGGAPAAGAAAVPPSAVVLAVRRGERAVRGRGAEDRRLHAGPRRRRRRRAGHGPGLHGRGPGGRCGSTAVRRAGLAAAGRRERRGGRGARSDRRPRPGHDVLLRLLRTRPLRRVPPARGCGPRRTSATTCASATSS